jgi:crossover junction endodeoxyribonuclease RusA
MTSVLTFHVPGNPQRKQRPRFNRSTGRAFTPHETVTAEREIAWTAKQAASEQGVALPFVNTVRVEIVFRSTVPADAAIGVVDGDNCEKLVADALNNVAWNDDRQVVEMHWRIERGSAAPGTDVRIEEVLSTPEPAEGEWL